MMNDILGNQIPLGSPALASAVGTRRRAGSRSSRSPARSARRCFRTCRRLRKRASPGYDVSAWNGLLAPARTPDAVIDKISRRRGQGRAVEGIRRTSCGRRRWKSSCWAPRRIEAFLAGGARQMVEAREEQRREGGLDTMKNTTTVAHRRRRELRRRPDRPGRRSRRARRARLSRLRMSRRAHDRAREPDADEGPGEGLHAASARPHGRRAARLACATACASSATWAPPIPMRRRAWSGVTRRTAGSAT